MKCAILIHILFNLAITRFYNLKTILSLGRIGLQRHFATNKSDYESFLINNNNNDKIIVYIL